MLELTTLGFNAIGLLVPVFGVIAFTVVGYKFYKDEIKPNKRKPMAVRNKRA